MIPGVKAIDIRRRLGMCHHAAKAAYSCCDDCLIAVLTMARLQSSQEDTVFCCCLDGDPAQHTTRVREIVAKLRAEGTAHD